MFRSFGIQCQPIHDSPNSLVSYTPTEAEAIPSRTATACDDLGSEIISCQTGCKLYTGAALGGLRRISVSRGSQGRGISRADSNVTGIWLEYHGNQSPALLGQWLAEFDSFDLCETEELTEVKIWLRKSHIDTERKAASGPVVRISLATSAGRTKSFQISDNLDRCIVASFRQNRYEKLVSSVQR